MAMCGYKARSKLLKCCTYAAYASTGNNAGVILGEKGPVRMNSATSRYDGPFLLFLRIIIYL